MRTCSVITLLVALGLASDAGAQSLAAAGILNGGDVRPAPVMTGAVGAAALQVDLVGGTATFDVAIFNLSSGITAAHLHLGTAEATGPILFDLRPVPNQTGDFVLQGTIDSASVSPQRELGIRDTVDALQSLIGLAVYIDIHTAGHPDGEVRGTLIPLVPEEQAAAAAYRGLRRAAPGRR